jgi:hypothetical protein
MSTMQATRFARRRPRRAETRVMRWVDRIMGATTGRDAVKTGLDWALSEITQLEARDPEAAEHARWMLARSLCLWSAQAPKASWQRRTGLTDAEAEQLLDPWQKRS